MGKMTLTDEERVWMEEHFAHTKNEEVARYLGVSRRTAVRLARGMGLAKSAEFARAMQANAVEHAVRANRGQGNAGKANLLKYGKAYRFKPGMGNKDRLSAEVLSEMYRRSAEITTDTRRSGILEQRAEKMGIRFYLTGKKHDTQGR